LWKHWIKRGKKHEPYELFYQDYEGIWLEITILRTREILYLQGFDKYINFLSQQYLTEMCKFDHNFFRYDYPDDLTP